MINISNVSKSFNGISQPVLNEINLSLKQGDFCVVLGANGCGKSTLLKLISGQHKADFGEITLKGRVSQVVQDVNLGTVPEMTLLENIALSEIKRPSIMFYHRYKKRAIQKLEELGYGLEKYIDKPLATLSGGQRQMVATLMAINARNAILLLDEHTSALDPKMQTELMAYTLKKVNQYKLTTVMITHKMADAIKYGDRLIMLHLGKIVFDIKGVKKQALSIEDLLALFHKYEDKLLAQGVCHGA